MAVRFKSPEYFRGASAAGSGMFAGMLPAEITRWYIDRAEAMGATVIDRAQVADDVRALYRIKAFEQPFFCAWSSWWATKTKTLEGTTGLIDRMIGLGPVNLAGKSYRRFTTTTGAPYTAGEPRLIRPGAGAGAPYIQIESRQKSSGEFVQGALVTDSLTLPAGLVYAGRSFKSQSGEAEIGFGAYRDANYVFKLGRGAAFVRSVAGVEASAGYAGGVPAQSDAVYAGGICETLGGFVSPIVNGGRVESGDSIHSGATVDQAFPDPASYPMRIGQNVRCSEIEDYRDHGQLVDMVFAVCKDEFVAGAIEVYFQSRYLS
ncbi:MAG: hypothetical protein CMP08_07575 [Xanthomonadales bacterium]|nr:hypothetical protein [Xanthomonadales bacterium]|tara:strand:- start:22 stop:975 length:954 start_codon:yes stop_codon:yes gene_type:complete